METELSEPNISDKDINTVGTKGCSYCNKPFIKELWCEECINSLEKLAKNNDEIAMFNLAICYKDGEGIEKNLEKAFHWYQKAAEKDHIKATINLAICYKNGEGTEKDLEKSFHWCQKAAENGDEGAMNILAMYYENGEGIEKDLEKAFYWYQKAAENGDEAAMNNLSMYYKDGKGTDKNLEKAYYWHLKAAESNKVSSKNISELCNECRRPYSNYQWCQKCDTKRLGSNFLNWTSENAFIDKLIQEAQLNAKNRYEILEWIPYNKLSSINYHDQGGFSEIHKAIWSDGPICSWNFNKKQWNRQMGNEVILKVLDNSNDNFLEEWKYHYCCHKKSFSKFIQLFGFSQYPDKNYIIVMSYAKKGNLRKCLSDIVEFKWQEKLQLLKKIILGLKVIHEAELVHGNFHDGNILISDNYNELFINDFRLCKPISYIQDNDNEPYGVLPYMAPEILRKSPYTPASDIYSFSMIMWEFTSGNPPFSYEECDAVSICEGKRPKIMENTPKCYADLMKKCWDEDPSNRPTVIMLENIISQWINCVNEYYRINDDENNIIMPNIDDPQLKNDMLEYVKANKANLEHQEKI